ncbi:hypothetical protein BRD22_05380 [Halobacteriales archaeon SW_8_68_21]|nr:MAG: hypothetical protein BRD22_05380 [Halobacteriales archaeon SW_8_68_21]
MIHDAEGSHTGPTLSIPEIDFARLDTVERAVDIRCAAGDRWTADWRGTPVSAVVPVSLSWDENPEELEALGIGEREDGRTAE